MSRRLTLFAALTLFILPVYGRTAGMPSYYLDRTLLEVSQEIISENLINDGARTIIKSLQEPIAVLAGVTLTSYLDTYQKVARPQDLYINWTQYLPIFDQLRSGINGQLLQVTGVSYSAASERIAAWFVDSQGQETLALKMLLLSVAMDHLTETVYSHKLLRMSREFDRDVKFFESSYLLSRLIKETFLSDLEFSSSIHLSDILMTFHRIKNSSELSDPYFHDIKENILRNLMRTLERSVYSYFIEFSEHRSLAKIFHKQNDELVEGFDGIPFETIIMGRGKYGFLQTGIGTIKNLLYMLSMLDLDADQARSMLTESRVGETLYENPRYIHLFLKAFGLNDLLKRETVSSDDVLRELLVRIYTPKAPENASESIPYGSTP